MRESSWRREYIIIASFLVYDGHDLVKPKGNGGVVPLLPIEEGVRSCSGGIEVVWASKGHDVGVLSDELFVNPE